MRGRKPKPTSQKRLEGNPGGRKLNEHEPEMPAASEDLPPELVADAVAMAEWSRLVPLLKKSHTVTQGDRGLLLALCQQWSRYLDANAKVTVAGMVVRAPSGYPMPNPYIAIANKALGNCVKLWVELGLTPSARSRVTTTPGAGDSFSDDPFNEFDEPLATPH
jgi:P27 family predicted phage terminase small subunit